MDTSATGAGKSYADFRAMEKAGTSLTVLATHKNCKETQGDLCRRGLDAAAYPQLSRKMCQNYDEAVEAVNCGLSASSAVCPDCRFKLTCDYVDLRDEAEKAAHRIATHSRAAMGFKELADGRKYIAIHEDPASLLRPTIDVSSVTHLKSVARIADQACGKAWELEDQDSRHWFQRMREAAEFLMEKLTTAQSTHLLPMPAGAGKQPRAADAKLYRAIQALGVYPNGEAVRVCKAIAAGELHELTVRVDNAFGPGGKVTEHRAVLAVWKTPLPDNATIWMCDATATVEEIERLAGCPVVNKTPSGTLAERHPVVQVPLDIKKRSSATVAMSTLRAVMTGMAGFNRVGIICHREHISAIRGTAKDGINLDESLRRRIVKIEHFHSGAGRGSNDWYTECDAIIVFGTPRVPPRTIKERLIRIGLHQAAARDEKWTAWGKDCWSGLTLSGRRKSVYCLGYRDRDWRDAYNAIVRSELRQSAGRGRAVCENGVPVVIISTEEIGARLADFQILPISESAAEILNAIQKINADRLSQPLPTGEQLSQPISTGTVAELTQPFSIAIIVENGCYKADPVSTVEIATFLEITPQAVRKHLENLESGGFVKRIGERGGWVLSTIDIFRPAQFEKSAAAVAVAVESVDEYIEWPT
ncbi:MAG TPA: helix-turn-helix domain-containing protein [Pirellulales bacterium]